MAFENIPLNLEILAEEAAEVIQIKSKIIRFGLDNFNPETGENNLDALTKEIGHFLAMVEILGKNGVLDSDKISQSMSHKIKKLAKFYPNKGE